MRLESARELKESLLATGLTAAAIAPRRAGARAAANRFELNAVAAGPVEEVPELPRSLAVGISKKRGRPGYSIALRVQRQALLNSDFVEQVKKKSRGEVDVRFIGRIVKRMAAVPWHQKRQRPMFIGSSVGHFKITAGTLGGFVENSAGMPFILSNNHVLANEDNARKGDAILQQGRLDGGRNPRDLVGRLGPWIKMNRRHNLVDAALAEIYDDILFYPTYLRDFPSNARTVRGLADEESLDIGDRVRKIGRTTGFTSGRVTAFELDNVVVSYDRGNLAFDDQIEIEGAGTGPFSDGGDSGSMIFDSDNRGIGLLFAGGDTGGTNGRGLTYANPLWTVLQRLRVKLIL
ncbi:MAG: hypothetical protein WEE89_06060 [Gemmatimonadota bacterium]